MKLTTEQKRNVIECLADWFDAEPEGRDVAYTAAAELADRLEEVMERWEVTI